MPSTQKIDGLLERVCHGLGLTPRQLAKALDVSYAAEVAPLVGVPRHAAEEVDYSEVWQGCLSMINTRLGLLMAAREDLETKLHNDRVKRALRREAITNR